MTAKLLAALAVLGLLPACTTITRGTRQNYSIVSEPPGAAVRLSTGQTCVTPCPLELKRKHSLVATLSKPGYISQELPVTGIGVTAMTVGDFLLGGVIGSVVDASNGSTRSLYPAHLNAKLVALPDAAAAVPAGVAGTVAPIVVAASGGAPALRKAPTISGYCLDVPADYAGDGTSVRPLTDKRTPSCATISSFLR